MLAAVDKKKRHSLDKIRKGSNSMSAQIQKTARRVSAVFVPNLVKMEPVPSLQSYTNILIKLNDIKTIQRAMESYILHNVTNFDPILFDIIPQGQSKSVLTAQLTAEELALMDGTKKLTSITFSEMNGANDCPEAGKIKHPTTGIKMFDIVDLARNGNWQILSSTDETCRLQFDSTTNFFHQLFSLCGLTFVPNWWTAKQQAFEVGQVQPQNSLFKENAMIITWKNDLDNELRILMLCYGLFQIIREGYPQMLKIIHEYRRKKAII